MIVYDAFSIYCGKPCLIQTCLYLLSGKLLLIYICNFHVLSHLLLIYICKLHWNSFPIDDKNNNNIGLLVFAERSYDENLNVRIYTGYTGFPVIDLYMYSLVGHHMWRNRIHLLDFFSTIIAYCYKIFIQ